MGEERRSIAWTTIKRIENIANLHNCVDLQDAEEGNIPIC